MDEQFHQLLHKYVNGKATVEEQQFLIKYYNLFESDTDLVTLLSEEESEELKKEINTLIWQNIDKHDKPHKRIISLITGTITMAAAAILIAVYILPVLFLPNKSNVKKIPSTLVHRQKENRFLILPDGSTAILSQGSKLNYPVSFAGAKKREVSLEGECFFDIKHDNSKPFIVHTGKIATTVLGTAFDVKALPGAKTITVTVTRGRVKVSDQNRLLGIIIRNQQITYYHYKSNSLQNNINAHTYIDWTEKDNLYFDDVTVAEAAKVLQDRFGVKILFTDQSVQARHFTSTFDKSASLDAELKSICEFNNALYYYNKEDATITISSKHKTN